MAFLVTLFYGSYIFTSNHWKNRNLKADMH